MSAGNSWPGRGAAGKRAQLLGLRSRTKGRAPCRYCKAEFLRNGIGLHESLCQRVATKEQDPKEPCGCGEFKPRGMATCWRCADRGPELRRLDEMLLAEDVIKPGWRGRAEG